MTPMNDKPLPRWAYVPGPRTARLDAWDCTLSGFSENLDRPLRRLEVSGSRIKLIIGFNTGYLLNSVDSIISPHRYQTFVIGMAGGVMTTEHCDAQSCIEVDLPPWAAFSLFGGDSSVLEAGLVDLSDIWGAQAVLLAEALNGSASWEGRFTIVERFLAHRLCHSRHNVRSELRWVWDELERHNGQVSMRSLRDGLGWSERHFAKHFNAILGLRPKAAARRLRFTHAHRLMTLDSAATLSDIAIICGYSDQSHFTREFRIFAGCSPAAYRAAGFSDALGKPASLLEQ